MQKKLSALCSQGTPVQAKYAVRALQFVSKNAASSNGKLFKELLAKLAEKKDVKQATVLRALAELCARAADKVQDDVIEVAQQVLLKTWKGSNAAELKCLAIALLRNYFLIRAESTSGKAKKNKKEEADARAVEFVDQLFDLIEGDSALLSGAKDGDKTLVRTAAASAVLKLARQKRYDDLVTLERYQQLAQLITAGESELSGALLEQLYKGLRSLNQLPLRYLAYFALYGSDREHLVKAKKYFAACVQTRRQFLKQNQDQFVQEEEDDEDRRGNKSIPNALKVIMRVMPEYSLPWTVHLLAHLPYFEDDSPSYALTVKYLHMWMDTVLRGSSTNAGNRSLVRQALVDIRQTNDAQDADNHNVHTVAELAYRLLNEHYAITAVQDKQASMETFYLPQTLFTMPEKLLSLSQTFLPDDYHLPAGKNKIQQLLAESDKKKAKESEDEASEEELQDKRQKHKKKTDDESESEVPPKGKKRKAAEPEESASKAKSKKSKHEETPAKGKGKQSKAEAEEEHEEAPAKTKKAGKSAAAEEEAQPRSKGKQSKTEPQERETKGKAGKKAEAADEPERVNSKAKKARQSQDADEEVAASPRKGKKPQPEPEEDASKSKKQSQSKPATKKGKAESDKTPNKKRKREASEEEDQEEPEITHKRKQRKTSK